jgi:hypothetical protein
MTLFSNNKDLWLYKGDTGNVSFGGLPKDKLYTAFFSIFDEDAERIIKEIPAKVYNQVEGTADFVIDKITSDELPIGDFTYALKICANGSEDTIIPETALENGVYVQKPAPSFSVYAKRVEGD